MIGISEQKAADALGVSLFELRAASKRLLTVGVHFELDPKKRPLLWPIAFDVLGKSLDLVPVVIAEKKAAAGWTVDVPAEVEKTAPEAAGEAAWPEMIDLFIGRLCPNPTWVECRLEDRRIAKVQVPNNRLLIPGKMMAACKLVRPGVYFWTQARRMRA